MRKIILITLVLIYCNNSNACDCDSIIGIESAKDVFIGKVISIRRIESPFIRYEISFKISKKIKGDIRMKKIVVNVPCLLEMCCGIPFNKKDKYMIYTFLREGMLYTNLCTESRKL